MTNTAKHLYENPDDILTSTPLRPLYQLLLLWTLLIAGFGAWDIYQSHKFEMKTAIALVRDSYNKDLVYRRWATMHGGVYVPVTEQTPPNPYLSHIRDRDITTPSGQRLTLMNPAYMTRQVHEIGKEQYGLQGHITSLNPIRPENSADVWETKALKEFENGAKELTSKELIDGKPFIRFMHALMVDEGCLKCHEGQGYKKGDVRGGISVSMPWSPVRDLIFGVLPMSETIYGSIWIVGVFGIVIGRRRLLSYLNERNIAERALHESDERLNTLFMDSPDVYLVIVDGIFVECNRAAEAMLRGDRKDIIGKPPELLSPEFQPDGKRSSESAVQIIKEALCTGNKTFEWVHRRLDGSDFFVEVSVSSMMLDGKPALFTAWRDITERKQIEQELQAKNTEMERFAYTVSHDLKSPLITIQAYAGMIKNNLQTGKYEQAQDDMKRIEGAADKMTSLLNDLLELSRAGRQMSEPSLIDMNRLVSDVLAQLTGVIKQSLVEVVVQPDLPAVLGDHKRIAQVVQNLIENAIKYRDGQTAPNLEIGTLQDGRECVFFVRDNGIGIDPRQHERVFGLFNKLDANSEGTGVGLALVKRIIEVHGGRVWVESEGEGFGSCFCFTVGS